MPVRQAPGCCEILIGRRPDASLALNRFQDDAASFVGHRFLKSTDIVPGHDPRTRDKGSIRFLVLLLAGQRESAKSASVEGAFRSHQPRLRVADRFAMLARDLQCSFVRLGPAVGQECLVHPAQPAEYLRELCLLLDVVEIADVHQLRCLILYGTHDARMAVTDAVDGDACQEVQIAAALSVPQVGAFTALESDVEAGVRRHDASFVCAGRSLESGLLRCLCGHMRVSPSSVLLTPAKGSGRDHRADPGIREYLHQQGAWSPAIDDVRPFHAAVHGGEACLDLGYHTLRGRTGRDHPLCLPGRQ